MSQNCGINASNVPPAVCHRSVSNNGRQKLHPGRLVLNTNVTVPWGEIKSQEAISTDKDIQKLTDKAYLWDCKWQYFMWPVLRNIQCIDSQNVLYDIRVHMPAWGIKQGLLTQCCCLTVKGLQLKMIFLFINRLYWLFFIINHLVNKMSEKCKMFPQCFWDIWEAGSYGNFSSQFT